MINLTGDERQLKATRQSAIFKMAPKSAVVSSSQKIAVIRPATAVTSSQKPTVIVASSPQKVTTAVRSAVMTSTQQLNRSAINMANIPVIKISATTPIKPAENTRNAYYFTYLYVYHTNVSNLIILTNEIAISCVFWAEIFSMPVLINFFLKKLSF